VKFGRAGPDLFIFHARSFLPTVNRSYYSRTVLNFGSRDAARTFTITLGIAVVSGTKVCRYNWDSAGSLGWPLPRSFLHSAITNAKI